MKVLIILTLLITSCTPDTNGHDVKAAEEIAIPTDIQTICVDGFKFYSVRQYMGYRSVTNILNADGTPRKCGS